MKILLTGCSGLLGTAVLNVAAEFGAEQNLDLSFVGLDVQEPKSTFSALEFHQGSFTDAALIDKILPGCDAVIHTAAYHHGYLKSHSATEFVHVNVGGLATLLDGCAKHGVRRVVFSSTMEVLVGLRWPSSGIQRLDERCTPRPDSIYSQSKLMCESLGRHYADYKGIEFLALRYQNVEQPNFRPLALLARGLTGEDTARANLRGIIAPDLSYDMALIGPETPLNNDDMVAAFKNCEAVVEKYWSGATKVLLSEGLSLSAHDLWPAVDISHARRILGWRPRTTFTSWLRERGWEGK